MLNRKVSIYVPGTVNGNQPALGLQAEQTDLVLNQLSRWFGGATVTDATGGWISENLGLVKESIRLVTSFTDAKGMFKHRGHVMDLASYLAETMGQESVAVELDGKLVFAESRKLKIAA